MDLKGYHCLADLFGKLNSQEKLEDDFTAIPEGGKLKFFWEKCGHEKIDASSIIERTKQKIRRDVMRRRRNYFLVASASVAASILICISTIHFLTHCENTNLDFQAIAEQMDSQSVEEVTLITAKEQLNLDEDALWGSLPSGYEAGRVDSLSDYTRNDLHSNEFGLRTTLNWRKVRLNIRFGLSPQKSTTKSNRGKVKIDTTITVLNIVPELHFDYDLGNNHNMSVYYSGYTRQPSIYDLLSVPDYTNPLNITMGNPGLKPAFGQSISVNYRGGNMEKQEMLYCGLRYNNTINDISRKRTYDEKSGVYTSRPENINGNWGIGGNIYYTNKLFKKIFARLATNANYNRRVSYVQIMGEANENDRNTSQMLSLMQDVEFAYKLEEHEFKINGAITYQQADNSYTNNSDYRTYDFYYGAECRLKLPLNLNLYTVVRSMNRRGYKDEASNTTQWLWNGELTYSFLKGKRGLLKFQVVDILQQRDFVNRWMNDTGQGETWTWGLGRYAMATFTYRFNDLSR